VIIKKEIHTNLSFLDNKYTEALRSPIAIEPIMYSKLALIEYCGWIEESMDKIAKRATKSKLDHKSEHSFNYEKYFDKTIIGRTSSFQYEDDFIKKMLIPAIGIHKSQSLENVLIKKRVLETLVTELSNLKIDRNRSAHTYTKYTHTYSAPSYYINSLNKIFPILRTVYSEIIKI